MRKSLSCWTTLIAIAMAGSAGAQGFVSREPGTLQAIEQRRVQLPGAEYVIPGGNGSQPPAGSARADLLSAIAAWLAAEFDLRAADTPPRIEFAPAARIVTLRYRGTLPGTRTNFAPADPVPTASQSDIVAVYSDAARTIYLPQEWTGGTPAELSVLVHEMVHHAQNLLYRRYECPQARERLAYLAQERWLGLFGGSLERDFGLDPLTLLVRTKCLH